MCILYNYLFGNVLLDRVVSSWNASAEFKWFSPSNILLLSYPTDKISYLLGQLDRNFFQNTHHYPLMRDKISHRVTSGVWIPPMVLELLRRYKTSFHDSIFKDYRIPQLLVSNTSNFPLFRKTQSIDISANEFKKYFFVYECYRTFKMIKKKIDSHLFLTTWETDRKKIRSWRIYKRVKPVKCWSHKKSVIILCRR